MSMTEWFQSSFSLANRRIGGDAPTFIIAEAGVAHFGSLDKALTLVDLAAEASADAFKTQAFSTETLISSALPEWRQRLKSREVGLDFLVRVKERCDSRGIPFLCTAHDDATLPWLETLAVPAIKIGSGERGNLPFIRRLAALGKPVLLSTGMYTAADVRDALGALAEGGCREAALLHCVTSYPTPPEQVNLRAMSVLRELFPGPVGYSDHTQGHAIPLAAVAMGAQVIEKHITLDFDVPNAQDWKVSCGPDDLAAFVRSIREVEAAMGRAEKVTQPCEQAAVGWATKSLVAARDLPAGAVLDATCLVAKRPGGGLTPDQLEALLGRRLARPVAAETPLHLDDLAEPQP